MSWLFINPNDTEAAERKERILDKIGAWWKAFVNKTEDLDALFHRKQKWDLPAWMGKHLGAIDERLKWEYAAEDGGGHRLAITPESEKQLRPLVRTVVERAPNLAGWKFYEYRQPESLDMAVMTVEVRTPAPLPNGVKVHARIGEHHRIDLAYLCPEFTEENDNPAFHQAFVLTECLLGEKVLDKWIGVIEATPPKPGGHVIALDALRETVTALIGSIQDQLPDQPCYTFATADDVEWTGFELNPKTCEDYPGKTDLFVGVTMMPNLAAAFFSSPSFDSSRFSRFGEVFCYLKLDSTSLGRPMNVDERVVFEDAVNESLIPRSLGCSIGGGTGILYSYLDLALTDVNKAIPLIQTALRKKKAAVRSWLLFMDSELADEWVGIWDETPPPP